VTSDPDYKVTTFIEVEYLKNGASYGQSYYSTLQETIPNIYRTVACLATLTKLVARVCQHQLSYLLLLITSPRSQSRKET